MSTDRAKDQHNCSEQEHFVHLAKAIEHLNQCAGDEDEWDQVQQEWHDKVLRRINEEDGY